MNSHKCINVTYFEVLGIWTALRQQQEHSSEGIVHNGTKKRGKAKRTAGNAVQKAKHT